MENRAGSGRSRMGFPFTKREAPDFSHFTFHISLFTFHFSLFTFHLSLSPYPDISSSGVTNAMNVGARLHAQTHQVGDVADAQFVHHPGFVDFDRS